jgi:hypothetical protein
MRFHPAFKLADIDIRQWAPVKDLATLCKGGSSGYGWSHHGQMSACPESYRLAEIQRLEVTPYDQSLKLNALSFGIVWHWLLEGYNSGHNPMPALKRLQGVPLEDAEKLTTMFLLYRRRYPKSPFKVLATEIRIQTTLPGVLCIERGKLVKKPQPYSVRYDAIIQYENMAIYSLEHKSAADIRATTGAEWGTNSSIHGQVWAWNRHPIAKKLGPMRGVLMDIASKQKEPDFARLPLYISAQQLAMHERNLRAWLGWRNQLYKEIGPDEVWPQNNKSCWSRYGPCSFMAHCHDGVSARLRVKPSPVAA